jgi:molecular chaperone GrpE
VTHQKTLVDKLNALIFGPPVPVLDYQDLTTLQQLDDKLESLLTYLNHQAGSPEDSALPGTSLAPAAEGAGVTELAEQVRKLAKTQFKANTLQEGQLAQQQETLTALQKAVEQHEQKSGEAVQQAIAATQLELFKSLLPVLDSLDAAFDTGRKQVLKLSMPGDTRQAIVAWLDGIRLARLRLLDVLKSYEVTPIPTLGQPFDPNRHVAVATDTSGRAAEGIIVAEDRRGYTTPDKVLRYAEVVVARIK